MIHGSPFGGTVNKPDKRCAAMSAPTIETRCIHGLDSFIICGSGGSVL